jgi:hypothetical protein
LLRELENTSHPSATVTPDETIGCLKEETMGLARYLRQRVIAPVGEMLCDMHVHDLLSSQPYRQSGRLEAHGFRSFSQNDEDGIIQETFTRIGAEAETFVEFGVGNGFQKTHDG